MYILKFEFNPKCLQKLSFLLSSKRLWNASKLLFFCSTSSEQPESLFWVTNRRLQYTVRYGKQCTVYDILLINWNCQPLFCLACKMNCQFFWFCLVWLSQAQHGWQCEWGLTLGQDNYGPRHLSPIWMGTIKYFIKSLFSFKVHWINKFACCIQTLNIQIQQLVFNWINQLDATTSQVYYLLFKYSSTCFGHPHAHHQELQLQ